MAPVGSRNQRWLFDLRHQVILPRNNYL
jgi:hypothetical protein